MSCSWSSLPHRPIGTRSSIELTPPAARAGTRAAPDQLAHRSNQAPRARLTRDTVAPVAEASIRELRNHGGEVMDRVAAGEHITITRDGKAVAELRPLPRPRATAAALVARFRRLPPVDPDHFRADVDAAVDQSL